MNLLFRNCKTLDGMRDILVKDGIFSKIEESGSGYNFGKCVERDLDGLLVIPGVIDPHVHVRDLGHRKKEDWLSCSEAALSGGVTTIFDMPNTIPATTDIESLDLKRKAAEKSLVNYKLYLGANNNNTVELDSILSSNPKDIAGIKIFMASSSENDIIDDVISTINLFKLAKKHDKVVAVHTEIQRCLDKWSEKILEKKIENHNLIRNRECAIKGTKEVLEIAKEIGNKLIICHVSTREELDLIREAKEDGVKVYCEISPHHLILNESIVKSAGNFAKVNPPLRTKDDNIALWEGINDGTVDFIGTDHAPHQLEEKLEDYSKAHSGFPGIETLLPLLLNEVNMGNLSLNKLVELTSSNITKIFNLASSDITEGNRANFVIIDLYKKYIVDPSKFKTKAKYSPFQNMEVMGSVVETFVTKL